MSFISNMRHTPAATKPPGTAPASCDSADPRLALMNLSVVQSRMDYLQKFLSYSVNTNTLLAQPQMDMVSGEIVAAIHQIILNGAALLSSTPISQSYAIEMIDEKGKDAPNPSPSSNSISELVNPKVEIQIEDEIGDYEIVELDAVELLAEHVHFCEICGKGFKRDANLRMHMRAHGNQFKTPEALAKPEKGRELIGRRTRFSCPYVGCNRNKQHKKFRPLKSVICVKNHFKRSHCPKMYSCNRCNKKSFSVVADLKSHLKHCGESKWRCSCGTTFSRKDKLFGHMTLFEGHMPAVVEEGVEEKGKSSVVVVEEENDDDDDDSNINVNDMDLMNMNDGLFEGLDGFDGIDNYSFQDALNSPVLVNALDSGLEEFFNFY